MNLSTEEKIMDLENIYLLWFLFNFFCTGFNKLFKYSLYLSLCQFTHWKYFPQTGLLYYVYLFFFSLSQQLFEHIINITPLFQNAQKYTLPLFFSILWLLIIIKLARHLIIINFPLVEKSNIHLRHSHCYCCCCAWDWTQLAASMEGRQREIWVATVSKF